MGLPAPPRLRSARRAPDADASWWRGMAPVHLSDAVTAAPPRQATRVKTAWDEECWHLVFEMDDADPWSTHTSRDQPLWDEEVVEVFVDPIGDLEGYFEIEINPLGTVKDLVLRRGVSGWRKNFAWSVEGLKSRVERTAAGWTAEMSIPFAALGAVRPSAGSVWRANFLRIDRPAGPGTEADLSAWSPTGLRQFHRAERFGFVEFVG